MTLDRAVPCEFLATHRYSPECSGRVGDNVNRRSLMATPDGQFFLVNGQNQRKS